MNTLRQDWEELKKPYLEGRQWVKEMGWNILYPVIPLIGLIILVTMALL
jgi:hypothetical protein